MKIPEGYKNTELGFIPNDWDVVTIKDILDMSTKTISTTSFNHRYYVGTENMYSYKRGVSPYLGILPYSQVREYYIGDILISNIRPYLQKIWLANNIGGCSSDVIVFRVKNLSKYFPAYIFNVLSSDLFFKYSMDNAIGTKMPRGDKFAIKEYCFAAPKNISEQRAIAEALSDVDELITALDKKIAKKRLIKQGAMQQLLTCKKRLKGFKEEWMEKTIEELGSLTGAGIDKKSYKDETPIRLVNYTDIFKRDYIYQNELDFWVTANEGKKNQCNVLKGDIFFTPSSEMPYDIALSALAMEDMPNVCYSYHIYRLRLNEDIDFLYRAYMFKSDSFYSQANQTCEGSGKRYVISLSKFKQMTVTYPSSQKEQRAIATILLSMDTEITNLEQKRNKYIAIKQGMMQKLLTGQIRLTKPQISIQPLLPNVIAGHIVNTLYQSQGWGRTKLQKALHLSSYYSQADLGACYIRNTAGPDDQSFMNQIDLKFKQYHHVEVFPNITLDGKKHYVYRPTEDIHILEKVYDGYPEITRQKIDFILSKMISWDLAQSEIISTLYAVWNNRLIKNQPISDELLLADFYKWSKHKSEYSSGEVLKMLDYMRKENIIPTGWGKYIEVREDW